MFQRLAFLVFLLIAIPANAQVVRMTDGEVGYKWTGFAIDEDHILTVAHADHDLAYIYTRLALIACDRVSHDRVRDIALFKCRMKHGQPLAKIAEHTRPSMLKISGHPEGQPLIRTLLYPIHTKISNARVRGSNEDCLVLEGKAYMGMSGSPVTDPDTGEVVGIQSAGGPNDTYCVSLDQIRKFLSGQTRKAK